jgi:hypothetical protein
VTAGTVGDPAAAQAGAVTPAGLEVFDPRRPHPARIYDYWCGGKDNFEADRRTGEQVAELAPWVRSGARGNRAFLTRAVRYLARAGVRQFLDIGSGLPSSPNVHQIAQRINPDSRVVYVDIDPIVLMHARALLAGDARTIVVAGDARDPHTILSDPDLHTHLDLGQPVAVLLTAVLHFIVGDDEPARITASLRDHLAAGSHLVISQVADLSDTGEHADRAAATRAAAQLYDTLAAPFVLRGPGQVTAMFHGFDLIDPGVVPANLWRPTRNRPGPRIPLLAGVSRL